jgi:hypothetical protein
MIAKSEGLKEKIYPGITVCARTESGNRGPEDAAEFVYLSCTRTKVKTADWSAPSRI